MNVNYFYSDTLTNDTEGNLVQLCRACAQQNKALAAWASRGDTESECELCDAANDPARLKVLQNAPGL